MFIYWLKDGAEQQLADFQEGDEFSPVPRVKTKKESGKKYIEIYDNPIDPTTVLPKVPQDLIEKVTFRERIHRGFRTEGMYRHEGADLMVKTSVDTYYDTGSFGELREEAQDIHVSAPSIDALKAIYALVRQGKLAPDEDWEKPSEPREVGAPATPATAEPVS